MKGVKAVSCDMNSDFREAFEEKCPHLEIVFDYFGVVKNFNDKVISEVRKDEQKRLRDDGDFPREQSLAGASTFLLRIRKPEEEGRTSGEGCVFRKKGASSSTLRSHVQGST